MSSSPRTKPTGRVEIEEAAIIAAADQLASLGPSQMTVRGVAEAAGVNHALVHRHLQTKERLIKGALERMAAESFEEVQGRAGGQLRLMDYPRVRRYVIALARCLIEDPTLASTQSSFPVLEHLIDRDIEHGLDRETAAARVSHGYVLSSEPNCSDPISPGPLASTSTPTMGHSTSSLRR